MRQRLRRRRKEDLPRLRRGWSWGSREAEGSFVFSSSFLLFGSWCALFFSFVWQSGGEGDQVALPEPSPGWGQDLFLKAGKIGCCLRGQRQAAAIALTVRM